MHDETLDAVYAKFASMYADSKAIRWKDELDLAIRAAGLEYGEVSRDWLASLNRPWVYGQSDEPFGDPQNNRAYRRLLNA